MKHVIDLTCMVTSPHDAMTRSCPSQSKKRHCHSCNVPIEVDECSHEVPHQSGSMECHVRSALGVRCGAWHPSSSGFSEDDRHNVFSIPLPRDSDVKCAMWAICLCACVIFWQSCLICAGNPSSTPVSRCGDRKVHRHRPGSPVSNIDQFHCSQSQQQRSLSCTAESHEGVSLQRSGGRDTPPLSWH